MKSEAHYATPREVKTNGRRSTCTPWCGGNGIKLHNTERHQANRSSRRRAKQALRDKR